ncbi:lipase family alpha/beta hydrolase [Knoellia subterranea]|uniref:AB hydrolase-1 domain-containing protein n=1 Tax=Knoellia subterranea KCTC 19937 TaxID=1385521 RepID=A0A0A0JNE1_9MICO|nr:alpha/beta fold hydrolase [Knoellia subterranea]KGN37141.1 hypothetical protein N803_14885 [Knoellia subterranea KCTC 19937]
MTEELPPTDASTTDVDPGAASPTAVEALLTRGVKRVAGVADRVVHHRVVNDARAVINAAAGDTLATAGSALSHTMGVRVLGHSIPLTREGLANAFPQASEEVVVLIHGLMVTESCWEQGQFGPQLEGDLGFTSVAVRYNTGLRISHNGRELDRVLTALVAHWPVPVTRLALVGHSMGGLVLHSALAQAADDAPWVGLVSDTITLGSPHLGAPLERALAGTTRLTGAVRHGAGLGRALGRRSVGIQDLARGRILDEEWNDPVATGRRWRRVDVPLRAGIRHLAIVGLLGKKINGPIAQLIGDGIVPASSARGSGRKAPRSRRFAGEDVVVLPGVGHLALVHDPSVYAAIRERLGARVDP